jgi:hypothetical protein
MNGLDEIGIAGERLQHSVLVGPEKLGHIRLLPSQVREVEPGQRILEVPPGFPEESEKFYTLDDISLLDKHLRALSKNAGEMRILASASRDA